MLQGLQQKVLSDQPPARILQEGLRLWGRNSVWFYYFFSNLKSADCKSENCEGLCIKDELGEDDQPKLGSKFSSLMESEGF